MMEYCWADGDDERIIYHPNDDAYEKTFECMADVPEWDTLGLCVKHYWEIVGGERIGTR